MTTESDMLALCDTYMETCGFVVLKYSTDRRTRAQLAGHPDRVYLGHGYCLFIEGKVGTNGFTTAEEDWWAEVGPHLALADNIVGMVWRCLDDARRWVEHSSWTESTGGTR